MASSRSVVITGASAGIGKALAFAFAARGYNLGLTSRRLSALEKVRGDIRAAHPGTEITIAAIDVDRTDTVEVALAEVFARMGGVDIVVVNAGVNAQTRVGAGAFAQEQQLVQTNVLGAMATIHAATQHFKARGRGHIVGISSLAALGAIPSQAAYCATKAALSMYLATARMELARFDIDVTTILPGFVQTEIVPDMGKYPFIVTADKAAAEIVSAIERRAPEAVVPAFPWKLLRPFLGRIPKRILRRIGG
jgi:short-subunit dehydrogenase